ncbi:MAG: PilZ domain-containing protein [Myxococcota bacterium]
MPRDERSSPPHATDDPTQEAREWASARVDAIIDAVADESGPIALSTVGQAQPERRTEPRYSLEEPAKVEIGSWAELLELYTKDISRDGIFIQTSSSPPPGTKVGVHLLLPDGAGTIRFQGKVVHVLAPESGSPPGFGVRFYDVTDEARNTLYWLVAQAKSAVTTPRTGEAARRRSASIEAAARRRSNAEAEAEERQRLRTILCEVGARSDLEVLELHGTPSIEQIDEAFGRMSQQWAPRHHRQGSSPEVLELYKAIHFRIERAYRRLRAGHGSSADAFAQALSNATLDKLE